MLTKGFIEPIMVKCKTGGRILLRSRRRKNGCEINLKNLHRQKYLQNIIEYSYFKRKVITYYLLQLVEKLVDRSKKPLHTHKFTKQIKNQQKKE